jgi:hypothetical protein
MTAQRQYQVIVHASSISAAYALKYVHLAITVLHTLALPVLRRSVHISSVPSVKR